MRAKARGGSRGAVPLAGRCLGVANAIAFLILSTNASVVMSMLFPVRSLGGHMRVSFLVFKSKVVVYLGQSVILTFRCSSVVFLKAGFV